MSVVQQKDCSRSHRSRVSVSALALDRRPAGILCHCTPWVSCYRSRSGWFSGHGAPLPNRLVGRAACCPHSRNVAESNRLMTHRPRGRRDRPTTAAGVTAGASAHQVHEPAGWCPQAGERSRAAGAGGARGHGRRRDHSARPPAQRVSDQQPAPHRSRAAGHHTHRPHRDPLPDHPEPPPLDETGHHRHPPSRDIHLPGPTAAKLFVPGLSRPGETDVAPSGRIRIRQSQRPIIEERHDRSGQIGR